MKKSMFLILASVLIAQSSYGYLIVNNKSGKNIQLCGCTYTKINQSGWYRGNWQTCKYTGFEDRFVYHLAAGDFIKIESEYLNKVNGLEARYFDSITKNFTRNREVVLIDTDRFDAGHVGSINKPQTIANFKFSKGYAKMLSAAAQYPITIDITYDESSEMLIFNMPKDEKELYETIAKSQLDEQIKAGASQLAGTQGVIDLIKGYTGDPNPSSCVIL